MAKPAKMDFGRCPACGGTLSVEECTTCDEFARTFQRVDRDTEWRERETLALFCSGCEFAIDLRTPSGRDKTSAEMLHEIGEFLEGLR